MFEKKYEIIFLRKEYSTMNIVGFLKTNKLLNNTIRFKNKTYQISIELPAFSRKITKVYIFDFDSGEQLKFDRIKTLLKPDELDLIVSNQIVKELAQSAVTDTKDKIINMILGAIIGGLLSALLMFFYMQSKIEEIYASFNTTTIIGA